MKRLLVLVGFAACFSVAATPARGEPSAPGDPAPGNLKAQLNAGGAAGEPLRNRELLRDFYGKRGHRAAWSREEQLSPAVDALLAALRSADREGLRSEEYHLAAIEALLARLRPPSADARPSDSASTTALDLLLSDAFLLYAGHLTGGRVDPRSVEPEWNIAGRARDLAFLLAAALDNGHLADTLAGLPPQREDYRRLRAALASQRAVVAAGGWPPVAPGPALSAGDRGPRVAALRARLGASGELQPGGSAGLEVFDTVLVDALRRFQSRHGLDPDAVAGRRTLAALNTTALQRVRLIEANLERLRWLPRELGPRHLVVNIADFRLDLIEDGAPSLSMRVIAGREARRTPFFFGEITTIVLNPSWTVPEKIAIEDKLPLILEDPGYLVEHGFEVFARSAGGWREIDPDSVDWTTLPATRFPYRLRQLPGPQNALGRVKFQIPNDHDIYLHDTPAHELFAQVRRTFSSGCIRLQRAFDLAERLLAADPAWTRERIEAAIEEGATVSVQLPAPLPVFLLYATAWVDDDGALQVREDVYGRDSALLEALSRPLTAR